MSQEELSVTVSRLSRIMELSKEDYQLLTLLIAASTIALGHHSFLEVIIPMAHSGLINSINEQETVLEFYQQIIPAGIKESSAYKIHMEGKKGGALIDDLSFDKQKHSIVN